MDAATPAVPGAVTGTTTNTSEDAAVARREALPFLYDRAAALEMELRRAANGNADAELTAGEVGTFNQLLSDARLALPQSKALREDLRDISFDDHAGDVYHLVHTTLVPTLRNALPDEDYDKR